MRVLEALQKAAQVELTEAQERDTDILRTMKSLGDVDGAVAAIAKHNAAKAERNEINAVIAEKEKTLTIGKQKLATLGVKADVVFQFEQPLIEADNEITRLTDQLRPAIAAEERAKEIVSRQEGLARLEAKAEALDTLVKYFDKDGIKATLLSEHIGGFEGRLNEVLSAWGYKCSLSIEPYEFLCTDARGITTPVKELSASEQLMFSVALQSAVSRAAGIGIVVADRMDTFLPAERAKANRCLHSLVSKGDLEQCILIVSDPSMEVRPVPNTEFFFVSDGSVQKLVPTA